MDINQFTQLFRRNTMAETPNSYNALYHQMKKIIYMQRHFEATNYQDIKRTPPIMIKLVYNDDFTEMNRTDESS